MRMRNVVRYQGGGFPLGGACRTGTKRAGTEPRPGPCHQEDAEERVLAQGRSGSISVASPALAAPGGARRPTFSFPYLCSPFSDLPPDSPCFSSRNREQTPGLTSVSGGKSGKTGRRSSFALLPQAVSRSRPCAGVEGGARGTGDAPRPGHTGDPG